MNIIKSLIRGDVHPAVGSLLTINFENGKSIQMYEEWLYHIYEDYAWDNEIGIDQLIGREMTDAHIERFKHK